MEQARLELAFPVGLSLRLPPVVLIPTLFADQASKNSGPTRVARKANRVVPTVNRHDMGFSSQYQYYMPIALACQAL